MRSSKSIRNDTNPCSESLENRYLRGRFLESSLVENFTIDAVRVIESIKWKVDMFHFAWNSPYIEDKFYDHQILYINWKQLGIEVLPKISNLKMHKNTHQFCKISKRYDLYKVLWKFIQRIRN